MTINAQQLYFILDNTPSEQNIMLVGKHGIGKSRILEEYYSKKNAKVVTLFLGQMSDPGDLIGLPEKNEKTGKTDFMLPYWFPTDDKPVVLFLDELNRARPEVLQTIMDLTLNRKLAGKTLPQGSRIISAVNNGNEYQLTDLDPALVSRFNIYEFCPTVQDWLEWAKAASIDERVINFIDKNPEYLDGGESAAVMTGAGFANSGFGDMAGLERSTDRRSWERASSVIKNSEELSENHLALLSGILGNSASSLFYKFCHESSVPGAKEILLEGIKLPALSIPEFAKVNKSLFVFIQNACKNNSDLINSPENIQLISQHLNNYFDWLESSNKKEIQMQFVSLVNSELYPDALNFIMEHCESLYKKMLKAIEL